MKACLLLADVVQVEVVEAERGEVREALAVLAEVRGDLHRAAHGLDA